MEDLPVLKKLLKSIAALVAIMTIGTCVGCVSSFRTDGPYQGRIIDAATTQPLEGVVVLGVWYTVEPNVAGSSSTFYDSVEVLTNESGQFNIAGKGIKFFSNLSEMYILIFKAGYEYPGFGTWIGLKGLRANVMWDDGKPVIKLKKLSDEEIKARVVSRPGLEGDRQKKLTIEINKERKSQGLRTL